VRLGWRKGKLGHGAGSMREGEMRREKKSILDVGNTAQRAKRIY
jgi:hypothetical protein